MSLGSNKSIEKKSNISGHNDYSFGAPESSSID